jgi:IclR family acetate operon transcriptional repressor
LPEELTSFTARTITDLDALKFNMEQARRQGYAVDDEEFDYGVRCIAAPVFDYRGKVVGAIGISGPTARIALEKVPMLAESVTKTAAALSDKMSFKRNG